MNKDLMNLVPEGTEEQAEPEGRVLQEEKYIPPEELLNPELIQPPEPPPAEAQELGGGETTLVSRQLAPAIEQGAGQIKKGLMKVKSDVWVGMALGAVVVLTARYVIHGEL